MGCRFPSTARPVSRALIIAALFNPVPRRVQVLIDGQFHRGKYDAALTLHLFAETARDEVALDALKEEMLRVVQETMEPDNASIWLKPVDADQL